MMPALIPGHFADSDNWTHKVGGRYSNTFTTTYGGWRATVYEREDYDWHWVLNPPDGEPIFSPRGSGPERYWQAMEQVQRRFDELEAGR